MTGLQASRREAFAALFSQMAPRLYRTALGILGNPHDASDALQEAGLKAYRHFDSLKLEEAGSAWLTRVLIHACYDLSRRRSRQVPTGLSPGEQSVSEPSGETDWELIAAIGQLPQEQRSTLVLRFYSDLSIPQIAKVLNIPQGTVKSRLHTAVGRLRSILGTVEREGAR